MSCNFMVIFYGPEEAHGVSEMDQRSHEASTRVEGAPLGHAPLPCRRPRGPS